MEVELKAYKTINYINKGMCLKGHHVLHNLGSNSAIVNFQNAHVIVKVVSGYVQVLLKTISHLHKIMVKSKISCKLMVIPT
jgi:hypothetical protein